MNTLLSVIPVVVRRTAANARLLLAVVAGAVLAAALMSTTSIYTDAIRELLVQPDRARQLGTRARNHARRFTAESLALALLDQT